MKDVHREGIKNLKQEKQGFTVEEEEMMWQKGIFGNSTVKMLMNTLYFYNGTIFGLRAGEHRIIRPRDFVVGNHFIQYTENSSKTHKGGLCDLKKNARVIKHIFDKCFKGEEHTRCLVGLYQQYLELVECLRIKGSAFYFQGFTDKFELKNIPLGIHSLNNIVPFLCEKAGLEKRTSHCLRVTCASRLFNENEKEELIRSRTGHTSDALSHYERPSLQQELGVSKVLGPPETEVYLMNEKEVLKFEDKIDCNERSESSELEALMEDYLPSDELRNVDWEGQSFDKVENEASARKTNNQPVNMNNCVVTINYHN